MSFERTRIEAGAEELKEFFPAQELLRREIARRIIRAADKVEVHEVPQSGESNMRLWGFLAGLLLGIGLELAFDDLHHLTTGTGVMIVAGAALLGLVCARR